MKNAMKGNYFVLKNKLIRGLFSDSNPDSWSNGNLKRGIKEVTITKSRKKEILSCFFAAVDDDTDNENDDDDLHLRNCCISSLEYL